MKILIVTKNTSINDFVKVCESNEFYKIFFKDDIDFSSYKKDNYNREITISSNKMIYGLNKTVNIGFKLIGDNIHISQLRFYEVKASILEHTNKCHGNNSIQISKNKKNNIIPNNILIDHCIFEDKDYSDKLPNKHHNKFINIQYGTNIEISRCIFRNHDKAILIGSDKSFINYLERTVNIHDCIFENIVQRCPRLYGARVNVCNNIYKNIGINGSGNILGVDINSKVNFFNNSIVSKNCEIVKNFYNKIDEFSPQIYSDIDSIKTTNIKFDFDNIKFEEIS